MLNVLWSMVVDACATFTPKLKIKHFESIDSYSLSVETKREEPNG